MDEFGRSGAIGGAAVVMVDAVHPTDEGDVGGAVGIVLDSFDDAQGRSSVTFEIDGSL